MKKLFENTTIYNYEEYKKFYSFHLNGKNKFSTFLFMIYILLFFAFSIYLLITKRIPIGIIFFAFSILIFVGRIYYPTLLAKRTIKASVSTDTIENHFTFYEDSFEIKNVSTVSNFPYNELYKIYETKKNYYFYIDKINAFPMAKDTFLLGDVFSFSSFIKTKKK